MERRCCHVVIDQMIEKIPVDKIDLIYDLKWNRDDSVYKAPEETLQWERTMNTLIEHISKPKEEWEFEALSIFTTTPIDELKKMVF